MLTCQTGCQTTGNVHTDVIATETALPDFSPERAANEVERLEQYKEKPDFSHLDVVTIVPADP